MNLQTVGQSDISSTRIAYGCMNIAGTWNPDDITPERRSKGREAIISAYEAGYNFFDHADIYCAGGCETIHGEVLREIPDMREEITIATKCGIIFGGNPNPDSPHRYDFSAKHIIESCEKSLSRLGTDTIDIYQLHRPDLLMNPVEVAQAFHKLKESGKVLYFGVSNFLPSFVSALQAHLDFPLIVNQVEIHLGRLDPFYDGTLDQCLELGITPLSWSPLWHGRFGKEDGVPVDHPKYAAYSNLVPLLKSLGEKYGVSPSVIALAWLLKHPSGIIPIIGTTNPDRIKESVKADEIELDREDWYRLLVAARNAPLP